MKKRNIRNLYISICLILAFIIWTAAICFVDIKPIGPNGSVVGFASINIFIHEVTGTNMFLYALTDYLSVIPIGFIIGFGLLGFIQWIKRKSMFNVDRSILFLGLFYIAVMAIYFFFEFFVINYRPVLIEGILEPSYPSSTTMLVLCVMSTAAIQFKDRIKLKILRAIAILVINIFTVFMVAARIFSGVHWFTDIIGGILISFWLVFMYVFVIKNEKDNK